MRRIDKMDNRAQGNHIVDNFLSEAWNNIESRYLGADYDGLNSKKYRNQLIPLLLNEQEYRCCYCMKSIDPHKTTIEHLIPQSASKDNFAPYMEVEELSDHVVHKDDFRRSKNEIPPAKYPHDIAYSNLIASCNATSNCNNYRKHKPIRPFVFDLQIEKKTKYDQAGRIDCEEYADSFYRLGLSNDYLTKIRKIWKKPSYSFDDFTNLTHEDINIKLYTLIDDPDFLQIIETFTPSQEKELMEYVWFGEYYKEIESINEQTIERNI